MEHRTQHTTPHLSHDAHTDTETLAGLVVAVALSVLGAVLLLSVF